MCGLIRLFPSLLCMFPYTVYNISDTLIGILGDIGLFCEIELFREDVGLSCGDVLLFCGSVLDRRYMALLRRYRGLLRTYRNLGWRNRALLRKDSALLRKYRKGRVHNCCQEGNHENAHLFFLSCGNV